jgi:ketosteroid isomerase-like protein
MDGSQSARANIDLVAQVGTQILGGFADPADDLFSDDFVFHFFNAHLPELAGDHHGLDGLSNLFQQLHDQSDTGFHSTPHSLTPYGDELVVAFATHTLSFGGNVFEVDAIVVWRVVGGRVQEGWDIPAINTVRPEESET